MNEKRSRSRVLPGIAKIFNCFEHEKRESAMKLRENAKRASPEPAFGGACADSSECCEKVNFDLENRTLDKIKTILYFVRTDAQNGHSGVSI